MTLMQWDMKYEEEEDVEEEDEDQEEDEGRVWLVGWLVVG